MKPDAASTAISASRSAAIEIMWRARSWNPRRISLPPNATGQAHLVCQLDGDLVGDRFHMGHHPLADSGAISDRHRLPLSLSGHCIGEHTGSRSPAETDGRSAYTEPSMGDTICWTAMAAGYDTCGN